MKRSTAKRKDWPRVREYVKHNITYYRVDLRREGYTGQKTKDFSELNLALAYAKERASEVNRTGLDVAKLVGNPAIAEQLNRVALAGFKDLAEAVDLAIEAKKQQQKLKEAPFVSALLSEWLLDRTEDKAQPIKKRSLQTIRSMSNAFKDAFGDMKLNQLNKQVCETFLNTFNTPTTIKNNRNYLGQFFNWAKRKEYTKDNPIELIPEPRSNTNGVEIFTMPQIKEILKKSLTEEHRAISNYVAICLFGGVRPEETERMGWEMIHDTGEIELPATITKTKKPRRFTINETLKAWLAHNEKEIPLIPNDLKNKKSAFFRSLSFKWIPDGLRHTMASYHYATHKDLNELRSILGNSVKMLDKHYLKPISKNHVAEFWTLTPDKV